MDEKVLEAKRKYYREWRKRNIEKVRAYQKEYQKEYQKKWRKNNKEKLKKNSEVFFTRLAEEQEQ